MHEATNHQKLLLSNPKINHKSFPHWIKLCVYVFPLCPYCPAWFWLSFFRYIEMLIKMSVVRTLYVRRALTRKMSSKAAVLVQSVVNTYTHWPVTHAHKHTLLTLVRSTLILDYPQWRETNRRERAWSCSSSESCTSFSNYAVKLPVNSLFSFLLILLGNVPKCLFLLYRNGLRDGVRSSGSGDRHTTPT